MNDGPWHPHTLHYYPSTGMAVIFQNSNHPSDVFVRDTDESPNAFTNMSHIFAAINPAL